MFRPNSELVFISYLRSLNLSSSSNFGIGSTLPEDKASWSDGFIQVAVVTGIPTIDMPTRRPTLQVDCWVPSINSSKPQWSKANTIAEDLVQSFYGLGNTGTKLALGPNFMDAQVQSVYAVGEPQRINNDPAGHARYTFDVNLIWITPEA